MRSSWRGRTLSSLARPMAHRPCCSRRSLPEPHAPSDLGRCRSSSLTGSPAGVARTVPSPARHASVCSMSESGAISDRTTANARGGARRSLQKRATSERLPIPDDDLPREARSGVDLETRWKRQGATRRKTVPILENPTMREKHHGYAIQDAASAARKLSSASAAAVPSTRA